MSNELQIVTQAQAVKLKELGFDWGWNTDKYDTRKEESAIPCVILCSECYLGGNLQYLILAPTTARTLKWLRENHGIMIRIYPDWDAEQDLRVTSNQWGFDMVNLKDDFESNTDKKWHGSFEEAESAGLDFSLNYLLNKNK